MCRVTLLNCHELVSQRCINLRSRARSYSTWLNSCCIIRQVGHRVKTLVFEESFLGQLARVGAGGVYAQVFYAVAFGNLGVLLGHKSHFADSQVPSGIEEVLPITPLRSLLSRILKSHLIRFWVATLAAVNLIFWRRRSVVLGSWL